MFSVFLDPFHALQEGVSYVWDVHLLPPHSLYSFLILSRGVSWGGFGGPGPPESLKGRQKRKLKEERKEIGKEGKKKKEKGTKKGKDIGKSTRQEGCPSCVGCAPFPSYFL